MTLIGLVGPKPERCLHTPATHPSKIIISSPPKWVQRQDSRRPLSKPWYPDPIFQRLPVELRVEIFAQAIGSHPDLRLGTTPLLFSQVSHRWRSLVLSTPRLWSSFMVDVQDSSHTGETNLVATMRLWLRRSKGHLLCFNVTYNPCAIAPSRLPGLLHTKVVTELIQHAPRWQRVELTLPTASIAQITTASLQGLPNLKSLVWQTKGNWHASPTPKIVTLGIPWHQLERLQLQLDQHNLLTFDDCLTILAQGVNLISCHLNVDCSFNIKCQDRTTASFSSLKLKYLHLSLQGGAQRYDNGVRITETPESCLVSFLEAVHFPHLTSLDMEWLVRWDPAGGNWPEVHQRFISVTHGWGGSLEHLRLGYLPLSENQLMDILTPLHWVTHLHLLFSLGEHGQDPITDRLLHILTGVNSTYCPLLPCLRSVHLQSHGDAWTSRCLLRFIKSRWEPAPGHSRLEYLRIVSMKPVPASIQLCVDAWKAVGLDIHIDSVALY
ncbi:hypothetical protein BD779DRAFT_353643 [Infundibulicybe gibba]|nr:hypothetical protein BD779DRAFT_353643 [Infundibulicybe gibba]